MKYREIILLFIMIVFFVAAFHIVPSSSIAQNSESIDNGKGEKIAVVNDDDDNDNDDDGDSGDIQNLNTGVFYSDLDDAVDDVNAGETLEFKTTKNYNSEEIDINKQNVTLQAAAGVTATLKADWEDYCLKIEASGVALNGLTVGNSDKHGIWVENASNVTISNVIIKSWVDKCGIYAENATNLTLTNISFEDCGEAGIKVSASTTVHVSGATTTRYTSHGCKDGMIILNSSGVVLSNLDIGTNWRNDLHIENSPGTHVSNSIFRKGKYGIYLKNSQNTIMGSINTENLWDASIYITDSGGSTFDGGTILNKDEGFYIIDSSNTTIKNATITGDNQGNYGIYLKDSPNSSILTCNISKSWSHGIKVEKSEDCSIRNTIIKDTNIGVYLYSNSPRAQVINNTIVDNHDSGIYIKSTSDNAVIKNNIIVHNGWNNWKWGIQCQNSSVNVAISYNDVWNNRVNYKNCSAGTGDISSDPQFVNNFSDVHLQSNSPCIDAGDPADPVGGEPEENGDRINQGAYGGTGEAQTTSAQELSIIKAALNGWINLYCCLWDGSQYINVSALSHVSALSQTEIPPWTGFWVYVERDLDILFPPRNSQTNPPNVMTLSVDPGRYYLISTPLQPSNGDINSVFGDDLGDGLHDGASGQMWRVSKYHHASDVYKRYTGPGSLDNILAGRGYWITHIHDTAKDITVTGSPVSQNNYTEFKLPVLSGQGTFHMIGNPFHYPITYGELYVRVPMTDGLPLGKVAAAATASDLIDIETWHIDLGITDLSDSYFDTDNRAGVIEKGPDYSSVLSTKDMAPFSDKYVRLLLTDPQDPENTAYAYDYRAPSNNEYIWEVELSTTLSDISVNFELKNIVSLPDHYFLTLTAPDGSIVDISEDTSLQVDLTDDINQTYVIKAIRKNPTVILEETPSIFGITHAAPNPFNPSTSISYTIAHAGHVSIKVYNLSGQEEATLVDSFMSAGIHEVVWKAAGKASGLYILVMEANGLRDTHKVTFLK